MRITNKMLQSNFMQNLDRNKFYLEKIHNRIASGKMVNRPSDDPVVVSRVMSIRSTLEEMEQFDKNMRDAGSWLEVSENSLSNLTDVLQRARELAVYGAGGTLTTEAMEGLADEVEQLIEESIQTANSAYGDAYIFGGTFTTHPPFIFNKDDGGISVEYRGDFKDINYEVSPGVQMTINASKSAWQLNEGEMKSEVFETLIELEQLLRNGDAEAASNFLSNIDDKIDHVLSERASLGAKSNRMDTALERSLDSQVEFSKILSRIEDTDYARAMIDFSVQEAAYHAAIKSGSQILQPTLLDFLR
ncbi:MAG: hypothetical protein APF76_02330 [Desulfitibacter sp. BRH_c19]|nr:MAG: hypothetical protein APF76_02330 [Desulfitibacter sp. BRH_c19]